jgi:Rab3 GTPase-activating protein catalytic subunit
MQVIHYLETLRPCQLLSQMICTAFSYVADILFRTEVGRPKDLKVEIDQLYATIVSILSPLREIKLSSKILQSISSFSMFPF